MVSISTSKRWKNNMKKISFLSLAIGCLSVAWHPVWAQDIVKSTEVAAPDSVSKGSLSEQGNPKISTQCVPNSSAQQALDALLRAYEQGNIGFFQQRLDPAMIGFSNFINDLMTMNNGQRQTRLQVLDRQMQCGPDVAVIDFAWEKYYLDTASFRPTVTRGRGSVLISGLGGGISGQWRVSGLVGDTPFKPSFADGSVVANPSVVSFAGTPSGCVAGAASGVASATLSAPASGTALVNAPPACMFPIAPITVACTVSAPGFFPPTVGTASPAVVNPNCSAVATGSPLGTGLAVLNYVLTGSQSFTAAPGSSVTIAVPSVLAATGSATAGPGSYTVTSSAVTTCTINVSISASATPAAPVCTSNNTVLNAAIEIRDADLTAPVAQVQVQASNGDSETFNLPKVAAGVYRLASLPITRGAKRVQPGSGRIELVGASPSAVTLTIRYMDTKSSTGASAVRQTTMTLVP
jgi:hypothetical protein